MKHGVKAAAGIFLALVVAATITGCSLFEAPTVETPGVQGASCTANSECISNSCVYPGVCE